MFVFVCKLLVYISNIHINTTQIHTHTYQYMQYKQYNIDMNLWSATPPHYKQIHANPCKIHAKNMQIHTNTRGLPITGLLCVMKVLGLYNICIYSYWHVFGFYWKKQYILIQSLQAWRYWKRISIQYFVSVHIDMYWNVLACIIAWKTSIESILA